MDDKKKEVFQLRLSEVQRNRLRFIATHQDKPESQVIRELINEETERAMAHAAVQASIPGAILQLKLPAAAGTMSYDDIIAMLGDTRVKEFKDGYTRLYKEHGKQLCAELRHPILPEFE